MNATTEGNDLAANLMAGAQASRDIGAVGATVILTGFNNGSLLTRPGLNRFLHFRESDNGQATMDWDGLYHALTPTTEATDTALDLNPSARAALTIAAALGSGRLIDRLGWLLGHMDASNALVVLRAFYAVMFHGELPLAGWPHDPLELPLFNNTIEALAALGTAEAVNSGTTEDVTRIA